MGHAEIELPNGSVHKIGPAEVLRTGGTKTEPVLDEAGFDRHVGRLRHQIISGGKPYVLLVVDEVGQVSVEALGLDATPEVLAVGLREVADGLLA